MGHERGLRPSKRSDSTPSSVLIITHTTIFRKESVNLATVRSPFRLASRPDADRLTLLDFVEFGPLTVQEDTLPSRNDPHG